MDEAFRQIREIAGEDEYSRRKAILSLRKLAFSLENVYDTVDRVGHLSLQTGVIQTGVELGLFRYLSEAPEPLTVDQITQRTGAERQTIVRCLRYLAAIDCIEEVEKGQYTANHITRNLSDEFAEAGLSMYYSLSAPSFLAIPKFLKANQLKCPNDLAHTPFQLAFNTDKTMFEWMSDHPEDLCHFNKYMSLSRKLSRRSWLDVYPVAAEAADWPADQPLFVDAGGALGHQCAKFKEVYPDLKGRVVLQDLAHTIHRALSTPGVENMVHDLFEPQPVIGAKFYYLGRVLHDLPMHRVRRMLEWIKQAMVPSSRLLVDEMVIPEAGVNEKAAARDWTVGSCLASKERTEVEWREVFEEVGLDLLCTYTYIPTTYEAVMEVCLPETVSIGEPKS